MAPNKILTTENNMVRLLLGCKKKDLILHEACKLNKDNGLCSHEYLFE